MPALSRDRIARFGLGLLVAAIALVWRVAYQERVAPTQSEDAWHMVDPAGLSHARRVAQILDVGGVLRVDAVNADRVFPPLYEALAAAAMRPWVPADDGACGWIERMLAALPMGFAALTAAVVAWAVARLSGCWAGLAAGLFQALCLASIQHSYWGNGDKRAAAVACLVLLCACLGRGLEGRQLDSLPGSLWRGMLLGLLGGMAVVFWPALLVVLATLSVWMALRCAMGRGMRAGLAALGSGLHAIAAVGGWMVLRAGATSANLGEVPLLGAEPSLRALGCGGIVLPAVWGLALAALRRQRVALEPWVLLAPLTLGLAFFDGAWAGVLAPVLAVLLGWSTGLLRGRLRRVAAVLAVCALQWFPIGQGAEALAKGLAPGRTPASERAWGIVDMLERSAPLWPGAMLAPSQWGPAVEWFSRRVAVRAPLSVPEGAAGAAAWLEAEGVELVLVPDAAAWRLTGLVARQADGLPGGGSGFLRQVLVAAPGPETSRAHKARIFQVVRGAWVTIDALAGERLRLDCIQGFPGEELEWTVEVEATEDGLLAVRVPYASDLPAGDGRLLGPIRWHLLGPRGERDGGEVFVPESAVQAGDSVRIQ